MANERRPKREPVQVGLVVALTNPVLPGRVIERLGGLMASLGIESVASAIVDACTTAEPLRRKLRRWVRRLDRPFDAEIEAFAVGLRRLRRRCRPGLFLLATDALLERSDEDLACLDRYALDFAEISGRTLGFLEAELKLLAVPGRRLFYRYANDLVVVPGAVRRREGTSAMLARLRAARAAAEVFDLRVVRRLRESKLDPARMSAEMLGRFAGPGGLVHGHPRQAAVRHAIDRSEFPPEARHGQPVPVRILGWAAAVPPVHTVEARAGASLVVAPVAVHRPDVAAAQPDLLEEVCGFDLTGELGPFRPGRYSVVWSVPGTSVTETVGAFRVLPELAIERIEALTPPAVATDAELPIGVHGTVLATEPVSIAVEVDGHPLEVRATIARRDEEGTRPDRVEFRAEAILPLPGEDHVVEVSCRDRGDREARQRVAVRLERAPGAPLRWSARAAGAHDPRSGRTPLHLAGTLFGLGAGERVAVRAGGRVLAGVEVAPWGDPTGGPGLATFEFRGEVSGLEPGETRLELVRTRDGGERVLETWTESVGALGFGLEVTSLKVLSQESGDVRLVAEGTVEPGHLLDSLLLHVDGELRARLGGEWLEPASSFEGTAARFHRFRFDSVLALEPGPRRLEIHTRRGLEERAVWSRTVEVEPPESRAELRLRSADLDRRVRDSPTPVWSRLELRGEVLGARPGDEVELALPEPRTAVAAVDGDGAFELAVRPRPGEPIDGHLRVSRRGDELVRSPGFRIAPRALVVAERSVAQLEAVLSRLVPAGSGFGGLSAAAVLATMFEREPGTIGDFRRALATLDERTREAVRRPGEVVVDPDEPPGPPLKVLFVAWEPPCHLHGGGVAIRNLLRAVSRRHEVTLVHTLAPGEEGLSDEVRPWVREILPVRREWRAPNFDPGFGVPDSHAWSYSPRYREAIEGELATGRYDLFNGDFLRTALHIDASDRPSVGVAHEIDSYAAVATVPEKFDSIETAADWVAAFLRALHFEAVFAPARFSEFATVTEPEARFLSRVLPGRRVFASPIPIDTDELGRAAALRDPAPAPVFLFFGNFIHPPNRDAARLLAEEIAPEVQRRRPGCTFVIAGANPPAELVEREGRFGVRVPGYVPDLGALTATATAVLAPLFHGAGMRVKLLEAMAAGCPVVSTPLGFSGIGGKDGVDWLEARTAADFVEAAVRLADDAALGRRLAESGRGFVVREYGIDAQGDRRERIWDAAIAAAAARQLAGD